MSLSTLLYSDNEHQGANLLSFRDPKETTLITKQDLLQSFLKETTPNSLSLFHGYLDKDLLLNLKTWALIYSVLKPNGYVKLQFSSISEKNFLQITNMLKANGFLNKDPFGGVLSNELLYMKPETKGNTVVIKTENKTSVNTEGDLKNKAVCGEFGYDKLIEVDGNKKKWGIGNDDDLLNEDDLLKNEKNYKPFEQKNNDSCATKPKACKNCSCGRKELEAKQNAEEVKKDLETGNVKSSCGNCYLGDAFRCAGCPYRGLPAFKPGDKVTLDLNSELKANEKDEGIKTNVTSDGRVKLN